jgi:hypothetical protein
MKVPACFLKASKAGMIIPLQYITVLAKFNQKSLSRGNSYPPPIYLKKGPKSWKPLIMVTNQ